MSFEINHGLMLAFSSAFFLQLSVLLASGFELDGKLGQLLASLDIFD